MLLRVSIPLHTRTSHPNCPICGKANHTCKGENEISHPRRDTTLISQGILTGRIVVPYSFEEGTLNRKDRLRQPMIAKERIVIAGRQLYVKGQKIRLADVDRYGIVDGRLPKPEDERPRRRKKAADTVERKEPDVEVGKDGGTQEQAADAEEGKAPKQSRRSSSTRKRRGARRA